MTFAEHKEQTAKDCEQIASFISNLACKVREGDMAEFERFWMDGGTEEGDSKIEALREILVIRYAYRHDSTK